MSNTRDGSSDFRRRSSLGVAGTGLVLLTPFAINNFIQGRVALGAGSLAIVIVLALLAAGCVRGYYNPALTFVGLTPTILFFLALALDRQGIIGALWCYPAALGFYCALDEGHAWLANIGLVAMALPMAWWRLDPAIALRVGATLITVCVLTTVFVRVITNQQRALEHMAVTDPLTGLGNRTLLDDALAFAVAHSHRTGTQMSLVALDVDHFKDINDTHGHDAGDTVLRKLADVVRTRLRQADRAFRLGGEEFLLLLDNTDKTGALSVAEELRTVLEDQKLGGLEVTASFGVAALGEDEGPETWMKRADEMLYRAKEEGRNLVWA